MALFLVGEVAELVAQITREAPAATARSASPTKQPPNALLSSIPAMVSMNIYPPMSNWI